MKTSDYIGKTIIDSKIQFEKDQIILEFESGETLIIPVDTLYQDTTIEENTNLNGTITKFCKVQNSGVLKHIMIQTENYCHYIDVQWDWREKLDKYHNQISLEQLKRLKIRNIKFLENKEVIINTECGKLYKLTNPNPAFDNNGCYYDYSISNHDKIIGSKIKDICSIWTLPYYIIMISTKKHVSHIVWDCGTDNNMWYDDPPKLIEI